MRLNATLLYYRFGKTSFGTSVDIIRPIQVVEFQDANPVSCT